MSDAVLLDLDGTLSDSRPGIESCLRLAMAEMGHPLDPAEDLRWTIGPPTEDVYTRLLARFDDRRVAETVAVYRRHYAAVGWNDNTPYDGIAAALAELAEGYRLFLATSKRVDFARMILEHFGFARHFTAIHGMEMDGGLAHKPELIGHIVARYGVDPRHAVMVGDREFDISGAHSQGMRTIGVLWGYGSEAEFVQAGADALVAAPAELLPAVRRLLHSGSER